MRVIGAQHSQLCEARQAAEHEGGQLANSRPEAHLQTLQATGNVIKNQTVLSARREKWEHAASSSADGSRDKLQTIEHH